MPPTITTCKYFDYLCIDVRDFRCCTCFSCFYIPPSASDSLANFTVVCDCLNQCLTFKYPNSLLVILMYRYLILIGPSPSILMGDLLSTSLISATIAISVNLFMSLLAIVATPLTYLFVILSLLPNLSRLKSALLFHTHVVTPVYCLKFSSSPLSKKVNLLQ